MRLWPLLAVAHALSPVQNLEVLLGRMRSKVEAFSGLERDLGEVINYLETAALPTLKGIVASLPEEGPRELMAREGLGRAILGLEGLCAVPHPKGLVSVWACVKWEMETVIWHLGPSSGTSRLRVWLATIFSYLRISLFPR